MAYIYKKKIGKKEYYYLRKSIIKNKKMVTKDIAYLGNSKEVAEKKLKYLKLDHSPRLLKKNDDFSDNDKWMLAEDIPDADLFFSQIWLSHFANEFGYPSNKAYRKILAILRGYHLWFYFLEKDSFDVGQNITDRFMKNPDFAVKVNREIIKKADELKAFAQSLPDSNLSKLSNKQLCKFYKLHDQTHTRCYQWFWIPVAADMFHNNLTNAFKNYLKSLGVNDEVLNEYFVILTQPTKKSLVQIESEEFLEIANKIQNDEYHKRLFKDLYTVFQEKEAAPFGLATHTPAYENLLEKKMDLIKDKIKPEIYKIIEDYYKKYFYIKYMWVGKEGITSFDYYLKELVKFIGRDSDAKKLLDEKYKETEELIKKRNSLIKKLNIKRKWKILFDAFGDFMVTKIYRRYTQIYTSYKMSFILEEIAKRLDLSVMDVRFMLAREVGDALLKNKYDKKEIKQRTGLCVYLVEKEKEDVFIGEKARKIAKLVESRKVGEVNEFSGQTGCVGKAKGTVKIIIRPADMIKMSKGDILVSIATDPDIVPAMKKAAAIVTEQGGVTSHAAIVSRELGIPCVIGTKIATRVLKDGDLVEVDANKGVVRKLNK